MDDRTGPTIIGSLPQRQDNARGLQVLCLARGGQTRCVHWAYYQHRHGASQPSRRFLKIKPHHLVMACYPLWQ